MAWLGLTYLRVLLWLIVLIGLVLAGVVLRLHRRGVVSSGACGMHALGLSLSIRLR